MTRYYVTLLLLTLLSAPAPAASLLELSKLSQDQPNSENADEKAAKKNKMRFTALRKMAITLGAQNGFNHRMAQIKKQIERNADPLDLIYDFNFLMKLDLSSQNDHYQLPPVIIETKESVEKKNPQFIVTTGATYKIMIPARLVSHPPNWREYLFLLGSIKVDVIQPHKALLPRNNEEQILWVEWITQGWQQGVRQADHEMADRIAKLGFEFVGMIKYVRLVTLNMVKPVALSQYHQAVDTDPTSMQIDKRTYQVATPATMNPDFKSWKAVETDPRSDYRYQPEKKAPKPKPSEKKPRINQVRQDD